MRPPLKKFKKNRKNIPIVTVIGSSLKVFKLKKKKAIESTHTKDSLIPLPPSISSNFSVFFF